MESEEKNDVNSISSLFKDRASVYSLLFSVLINGASWVLLLYFIEPQEEPLFLHYNIYFGVDLIGEWYRIFYVPGAALLIILVNFLLSVVICRKDLTAIRIILGTTVVVQIISLISVLFLIRLNT